MAQLIFNAGYLLNFIGLAVRDILWLRTILIAAQLSLISAGLLMNNHALVFWNFIFLAVNVVWIVRIIKERKFISLSPELEHFYNNVFSMMNRHEFLYFWNMGHMHYTKNSCLIKEGTRQEDISLITSGKLGIFKNGKKVTELDKDNFVAEISFLTGNPASATVIAEGEVSYMSWNQHKIKNLETLNPRLLNKIHGILGKDLAIKVNKASQKMQP